ncbi:MAG: STAS domain-containing protein [Planctomycetes bacterium]|nr:STAS domain-containing protein [Planctomycetota bacterium]
MTPTENPDPYSVDTGGRPAGAAPRPIDPPFDVIEERGIYVITLLRSEMIDAQKIQECGDQITKYLANKPSAKVALDMKGVQFLSSSALGMLLTLKTTIEGKGGALQLAGVKPDIMEVFKITKLHKLFGMSDNVDAAKARL